MSTCRFLLCVIYHIWPGETRFRITIDCSSEDVTKREVIWSVCKSVVINASKCSILLLVLHGKVPSSRFHSYTLEYVYLGAIILLEATRFSSEAYVRKYSWDS